jgi:hypothetical protein
MRLLRLLSLPKTLLGSGRRTVVGALRPGNAGGAKGPDFWCARSAIFSL